MSPVVIMDPPAISQCWCMNLTESSEHRCQLSPLGEDRLLFQDQASFKNNVMSSLFS